MIEPGMKVTSRLQPDWGVGHVLKVDEEDQRAAVAFPGLQDKTTIVSTKTLDRAKLSGPVRFSGGRGEVVACEGSKAGLYQYRVRAAGEERSFGEDELRGPEPISDLVTAFSAGKLGDARDFTLRRQALRLDAERRCDALGAMLASRVRVQPHQIGVVQRVLTSSRPRFILADEVGLGKTIEAGMVFSALRLGGLARRVLVVAPSHLTVQWLVELEHKFNQRFSMISSDTEPAEWDEAELAITSLELLQRNEEHREAAAATPWDLVIIDEAHHLRGAKAFEAAELLAQNTWGLLLLTATPMQLDPEEYQRLLTLVDEERAPTREQLQKRLRTQTELAESVRALRDPKRRKKALAELIARFPEDTELAELDADAALAHLAETYSLSEALVRNRRAVVGGFATRQLVRHKVKPTANDIAAREKFWSEALPSGAALTSVVKRMESSSEAKLEAFGSLTEHIWKEEPGTKILVFCEARDTLDALIAKLEYRGVSALAYHGDLGLIERDRHVARFRDPEGPKVLVCTEVGGEGRNFQFAHHLVCYDLPWSPSVVEQRIGRLDRIGQTKPIMIHVFDVEGSFSSLVLDVLDDGVGVFNETVGGLDSVLEQVESGLTQLASQRSANAKAFIDQLKDNVRVARDRTRQGYDPLLDERSFDAQGLQALATRAEERMQLDDDDQPLADRFWVVARDLEERLEDTATALARRIGIQVDTDDQVDAFQCAFHFGYAANVDALPGLDIHDDRTVLGTFWRETALEQEEIDYFATGHPVVEALFGMLRDGPFGRLAAAKIRSKKLPSFGYVLTYQLEPEEAADTHPGAQVPARQLSRFMDSTLFDVFVAVRDGQLQVVPSLADAFDSAKREPLSPQELAQMGPMLGKGAKRVLEVGRAAAQAKLLDVIDATTDAIVAESTLRQDRLARALTHQGIDPEPLLDAEEETYAAILKAAAGMRVELDSICAWVVDQ